MRGGGFAMSDKKLAIVALGVLAVIAAAPAILLGPLGLGGGGSSRLAAVLTFVGVLVTALVSLIGLMLNRQTERRLAQEQAEQRQQLRLDAAMRAGQLVSPTESGAAPPAALASGLLALTKLDNVVLAVALLVDLWTDEPGRQEGRISDETAILVIDAALRSKSPSARLVAAELLCRHATRLSACQSLHWPSVVDGCWDRDFRPKTKLLIVEALVRMTTHSAPDEGALRSVAVRLYGIWETENGDEEGKRVRGCIGKLIRVVYDRLRDFRHQELVHGSRIVKISQLEEAAQSAAANPDGYLDDLSNQLSEQLAVWARTCEVPPSGPGALATAV